MITLKLGPVNLDSYKLTIQLLHLPSFSVDDKNCKDCKVWYGGSICHFRNKKWSGMSCISQSLLGMHRQAGCHFVPSNSPTSDCKMRLAPVCFSFLFLLLLLCGYQHSSEMMMMMMMVVIFVIIIIILLNDNIIYNLHQILKEQRDVWASAARCQ